MAASAGWRGELRWQPALQAGDVLGGVGGAVVLGAWRRRRIWHGTTRAAATRRRGSGTAARIAGSVARRVADSGGAQSCQRRVDLETEGGATGWSGGKTD
jgi:hypothetical protein